MGGHGDRLGVSNQLLSASISQWKVEKRGAGVGKPSEYGKTEKNYIKITTGRKGEFISGRKRESISDRKREEMSDGRRECL